MDKPAGIKLFCCEDGYYANIDREDYKFPYGVLAVGISDLDIQMLKSAILSCPYFYEPAPAEWKGFYPLGDWLKDKLSDIMDPVTTNFIFFDIFNFISYCFDKKYKFRDDSDEEYDERTLIIKEGIFCNTGYSSYGADTIGHLLLTALCNITLWFAVAIEALGNICDGKEDIVKKSISPKKWEDTYVPCQFTTIFGKVQTVFIIEKLDALLLLELSKICENKIKIKKCQNCGKYFIPESRADEIYCNRTSPQDDQMDCKEYGSKKLWYDRLKSDEAAKLSRNIYMAKQMLVKRNPDIAEYKKMFEFFKQERKKWEKEVKEGIKTRDEYIAWLNLMKSKKTL